MNASASEYSAVKTLSATRVASTAWPSGVVVTRGNWSLFEDRAGKPGWISTGPVGSTVEFSIMVNATPMLTLVYDKSHVGFGSAVLRFRGRRDAQYVLSGQRADGAKVTQTDVTVIDLRRDNAAQSQGALVGAARCRGNIVASV